MAYVDDTLLEEDKEQGGPNLGAGASTLTKTTSAAPSNAQKTPGNFANLSEYLRVNAPQQFGQQVAGKIGNEINQGEQAVDQAGTDFKSRVDANTVRDTSGVLGQVGSDPTKVNPNDFARLRDASYAGPKTLSDTKDIASRVEGAADTATAKAKASQTEGGRFALLDNYFGRPNYSQGEKTLDNLLVQNDPNSQQAFSEMQKRAQDLSDKKNALSPSLSGYAAQGAGTTDATRNSALGTLGIDSNRQLTGTGAIGDLNSAVNKRVTDTNKRNQDAYNAAIANAGNNKFSLSPEFLSAMGISTPGFDKGYGVDPSKFVSAVNPITREQALSPDEVARAKALDSLGGGNLGLFNGYDQAGAAANLPQTNVNSQGYQTAVASAKQDYTSANNSIEKQVGDLTAQATALRNSQMEDPAQVQQQLQPILNQISQLRAQQRTLNAQYLGIGT